VDTPDKRTSRSVFGLVFLTAFLDLAGFSIIFPLFPQMLEHYLQREGPHSMIGGIAHQLQELVSTEADARFLVYALFGGLLGSLYSVLQFVFAPIWGSLSDRIGRRPTLLVTLAGTAFANLLWVFAGSFGLLVAARLIGGLMAGNVATVSAVVADTTTHETRSRGMGMMGAAIGLGFIFGPAIGGFSSHWDLLAVWPSLGPGAGNGLGAWGLNPFSAPALAALVLALINFGWAAARFPETRPEHLRGRGTQERTINPITLFTGMSEPGLRRVTLVYFLFFVAFSAIEFTLVFLVVERFGYTPTDNALMFVYVGVIIALVQGGLLRRLAPRFGDKPLGLFGVFVVAPGFALIGAATGGGMLYFGLACMAVGSALVMPTLSALTSRYAPAEHQGRALGTLRSAGALARSLGPALGGALYWNLGSQGPYYLGAAFLILPLVLGLGLPAPLAGPAAGAGPGE